MRSQDSDISSSKLLRRPKRSTALEYWQLEGHRAMVMRASTTRTMASSRPPALRTPHQCNVKSWLVRVHLLPHQQAVEALADGVPLVVGSEMARLLRPEATPGRVGSSAARDGWDCAANEGGGYHELRCPLVEASSSWSTRSCTTPEGMASSMPSVRLRNNCYWYLLAKLHGVSRDE